MRMRIEIITPYNGIDDIELTLRTNRFKDVYLSSVRDNGNSVWAVLLGGSHSKNIHNSKSDIDIDIHYLRDLSNLISVTPRTLNISNHPQLEIAQREAPTYIFEDTEFEVTTYALYSVGLGGKQTIPAIYQQNGKVITDILRHYPLYVNTQFQELINILTEKYHYSTYAMMGYFNGYMTSQLLKHRRKEDYNKRICQAVNKGDINPVVKAMIEGIYIGLSGVAFCEGKISRDFEWLWNKYQDYFTVRDRDFIHEIYEYKKERGEMMTRVDTFIMKATEVRQSIFDKIREMHKEFMVNPYFPNELSNEEKEENAEMLNGLLRKWYRDEEVL